MVANLKQLQKHWYKILKSKGFEDIEYTSSPRELLKNWHSSYFLVQYTRSEYEEKEQYYQLARGFALNYDFKTALEKKVWHLHAEGLSYRAIAKKTKLNKDKVNQIVSNHLKIMTGQA